MRPLLALVLLMASSASATELGADAEAVLSGKTDAMANFNYQNDVADHPLEELWAVYEGLRAKLLADEEEDWSRNLLYMAILREIAGRNEGDDFKKLVGEYASMPASRRYLKGQILASLLDVRAHTFVDELPATAGPMLQPTTAEEPPEHITPDVTDAWRAYKGLAGIRPGATSEPINAQQNWSPLHRAMSDMMLGKPGAHAEIIRRFEWGGMCGTGSGSLYEPRGRALFIASVMAERWGDAAWYALDASTGNERSNTQSHWQSEYLTWAGLDPATMYLGAAIDDFDSRYLTALRGMGGEHAARAVLRAGTLRRADRPHWKSAWLGQLDAFIGPGPRLPHDGLVFGSSGVEPAIPPEEIAADIQLEALQALIEAVHPEATPYELKQVTRTLSKLRRPESRAALEWALKSPIREVAENAAGGLNALGHKVELPELPDAEFRLLVNGVPLKEGQINWKVVTGPYGSGVSSYRPLDDKATVSIERKFLDGSGQEISELVFETGDLKSHDAPWFHTSIPLPDDLGQRTDVGIETAPLHIDLEGLAIADNAEATVSMLYHYGEGAADYKHPSLMGFAVPAGDGLHFANIQLGTYVLTITVDGAAAFETDKIELKPGGTTESVELSPGGTLRFEIKPPGGDDADAPVIELVPVDVTPPGGLKRNWTYNGNVSLGGFRSPTEAHTWQGLPAGTYTLRVLSSAEKRRQKEGHMPATHPHAGLERQVVIEGEVDLGVLTLEATR